VLLRGAVEQPRGRGSPERRLVTLGRQQRGLEGVQRRAQHLVARLERQQVRAGGEQVTELVTAQVVHPKLLLRVSAHDPHPLGGSRVDVVVRAGCEELDHRLVEVAELHQVGAVVGEEHLAQVVRLLAELGCQVGQGQTAWVQLEDAEGARQGGKTLRVAGQLAHASTIACSSASISARTSSGDSTRTRVPSS